MKQKLFPVTLLLVLLTIGCTHDDNISAIIKSIEERYSPDKRESVFNVSYKKIKGTKYILSGELDSQEAKAALLDTLTKTGYTINDSIIVLPYNIDKTWGVITLSVANLRSGPSHSSEMLSQALMGTPVKILKEQNGWAFIQTPDRYLAWCEKIALSFKNEDEFKQWKHSNRVLVMKYLTFIIDPDSELNISDVVKGDILENIGEVKGDIVVKLPDGRTGLISSSDVTNFSSWMEQIKPEPQNLINTAVDFTGIPYLWGGTSPKAMDCSGFVKTIYFLNGIILARDASLQVNYGTSIPITNGWRDFQPGDLLFFSSEPGGEKITHVGMYKGDSEIIHASGLVRVNSLDSTKTNYNKYYAKNLHSVKRIIGTDPTPGIATLKEHPWYSDLIKE